MTRTSRRFAANSLTAWLSLALAYALLISLCAPFTSGTTTTSRRATIAAPSRTLKRSRSAKATAQTITKKKGGHRDGELLARFRSTASPQDINALLTARAIARTGQLRGASRIERLTVPIGQDPETIAAELRTYPIIDFVEPNYLISKDDTTPNDPQFPEQWALHNTGATAGHAGADIGVMPAWDTTTGSSSTVIAVIDSGIDFSHPDLANNQWTNAAETKNKQDEDGDGFIDDTHGWDFVADAPIIKDEAGHGTAVAGIIAAEGNNGVGIAGVMWKAQLMNLRVLDKAGTGDVAMAVEAIDYATAHGAQVINLSWGTDEASLALKDAIRRAGRRNIVVVCAAGNDARDVESAPYYPASFDLTNLISAAATDNQDALAAWSNSGQTHITIAAPGVDVLTTKAGKGYQTISGTSASAPLVAGVAGLVKTLRPQLSAAQTKAMIVNGARSVAALAGKVSTGGIMSAAGALQAISALPLNEGVGSSGSEGSNNNSNSSGNAGTTGNNATGGGSSGNAGGNSHGNGNYTGRPHAVPPPPERGAPGLNLPNLDVERKRPHHEPHVPASTHPDLQKGAPARQSSALQPGEAYPLLAHADKNQYQVDLTAAMKKDDHYLFNSLVADVSFDEMLRHTLSDTVLPLLQPRGEEAVTSTADSSGDNIAASVLAGAVGNAAVSAPFFAMQSGVTFTDDPIVAGTTVIKAVHITELRGAVNQARARANLAAAVWTDANLAAGYLIRAVHITELRARLDEARAALGMSAATYTDPQLTSGSSGVRGVHIQELRQRVTEALSASPTPSPTPTGGLQAALLDPMNRTGGGGEDPLSRNFNWSVPLLNLSGRAGLDLGLALSYNSLVWTRVGSSIIYNADQGTPAPGFRLGFPVIGAGYYNAEAGTNAYLVTMPSGAHVELRQVGSSNTYEAADSSYLQGDAGSLQLRTTDGTQFQYAAIGGGFECTQIKDRNGNFITVGYNQSGYISTITDTLARVITFKYDAGGSLLQSITQAWTVNGQPVTHTWATFSYDWRAIQTNFVDGSTALSVNGPANGSSVMALTKVNLDDGSAYQFDYNTYGQVRRIARQTPDSDTGVLTERSVTSYNLPLDSSVPQSDCPRFTERHDTAQDWTGQNDVPADVITTYSVPAATTWDVEGTSHSGKVCQLTAPNGTVIKDYYDIGGWQRGLESRTEFFSSDQLNSPKKWTTTTWTQDNTTLGYPLNPKIAETNVRDSDQNRRRSTISYTSYGLPEDTVEYDVNGTTPLRSTHTTYNLDAAYLNRRIIGLPSEQTMSGRDPVDGTTKLYSKVGYVYDEGGEFMTSVSPVQHDDANYSSGFIAGRGNVTSVRRYDVATNSYVESKSGYDAAGNVRFTRRPGDDAAHQTSIEYTDSFSDGVNHNTYAYPTRVTDADGYQSTVKYRYDIGAVTLTHDPKGAETTVEYDTVGRKQRVSSTSGAQTRVEYPQSLMIVNTFTLIDPGVENYSAQVLDGAGRVRATGGDYVSHDGASTAVYHAQVVRYDVMGRAFAQSNPTEINAAWQPAGNDAAGWLWSQQSYDWKGRPLISTNTDGTTKVASYGGCGCAGGEVTTLLDEVGRRQRSYADVLGRAVKAQVLNWDGSVYSTTTNTYNARDQVMQVIEAAGESATGQTTTISYDGHGRVASKQSPIESAANTYSYNADDTTQTATDARGVVATYSYNRRRQVTGISYSAPAGVAATATVSFDYDAAGNRLWMTDGAGRVDYTFDTWSRLRSETRQFTGLSGSFPLSYDYTLAGQLKSLTDPFGAVVNYSYDQAGQLTDVNGTAYGQAQTYASNMQYRAWGALKHMRYGNGLVADATYNARRQTTGFAVTGGTTPYQPSTVMNKSYEYSADGRIRMAHDMLDNRFDRAFEFDHVGRLSKALSGVDARDYINGTQVGGNFSDIPYYQHTQYDVWGNITNRDGRFWSGFDSFAATYDGMGRNQNAQRRYDEAGHVRQDESRSYVVDAAGQVVQMTDVGEARNNVTRSFDGDGGRVKEVQRYVNPSYPQNPVIVTTTYYVASSVLGGRVVTEINGQGQKNRTYAYAFGEVIGWQLEYYHVVQWNVSDPVTGSRKETSEGGSVNMVVEVDTMGVSVGESDPYIIIEPDPEPQPERLPSLKGYDGFDTSGRCTLDGMSIGCSMVGRLISSGAAVQAPAQLTTVYVTYNNGTHQTFTGQTNLPPGIDVRFTGQMARDAALGFNIGNILGGFSAGVSMGIVNAFAGRANTIEGPRGGVTGGFAFSFVPPNTALIDGFDPFKSNPRYAECAKLTSNAPPAHAATAIDAIASFVGISPTLLAVTWAGESSFNFAPSQNLNDLKPGNRDVGPLQINYNTFHNSPLLRGLGGAFGDLRSFGIFDGSPIDNLTAGARILKSYGSGRTAAGDYRTGLGSYSGTKAGKAAFNARANLYDELAPGYDAFFNCLRGK